MKLNGGRRTSSIAPVTGIVSHLFDQVKYTRSEITPDKLAEFLIEAKEQQEKREQERAEAHLNAKHQEVVETVKARYVSIIPSPSPLRFLLTLCFLPDQGPG